MWFSKKTPEMPVKTKKQSRLTIYFMNGDTLSWTSSTWNGKDFIWKHFYKWYFSRNSEHYIMHAKQRDTMFSKKDILRFVVDTVDIPI